jgi:hypothetical protein
MDTLCHHDGWQSCPVARRVARGVDPRKHWWRWLVKGSSWPGMPWFSRVRRLVEIFFGIITRAIRIFIDAYNERCKPSPGPKPPTRSSPKAHRQKTSDTRH